MMLDIWRDVVLKAVLEQFSPLALKVVTNPQVQALLTQALNLQADMRQNIEAQVKLVARTLELVTRDELTSLRAVVKELEAEVERLKAKVREAQSAQTASTGDARTAPAPEAPEAPADTPQSAPEPAPPPKRKSSKKSQA